MTTRLAHNDVPLGRFRTGYCMRCGGDCFNERTADGVLNVPHRCPPKRREAESVIRVKNAIYQVRQRLNARFQWPQSIEPLFQELRAAVDELEKEL